MKDKKRKGRKPIDHLGERYGNLLVIEQVIHNNMTAWKCKCDCGVETIVQPSSLKYRSGCRSCVAQLRHDKKLKANPDYRQEAWLFKTYKGNAKLRELEFNLSKEDFLNLTRDNCFYCNASPRLSSNKRYLSTLQWNGIDRVDNSKGYTIENSVGCCDICNYAKKKLDLDQFKIWIQRVYTHLIK